MSDQDDPPDAPDDGVDPKVRVYREALQRLPIFPMPNVVLFPHALLPLHIFEPRYRKMTRDILSSHRFLSLALLQAPEREDGPATPAVEPVAGVGEIVMAHELPDGRYNLVVRGKARIHIDEEWISDEPYRLVRATELCDLPVANPQELKEADQSLRLLVGRLAEAIPEGGELLRQVVSAQETPAELADVVAAALVVDQRLRQHLLETRDVLKRLERLSAEVVVMTGRLKGGAREN